MTDPATIEQAASQLRGLTYEQLEELRAKSRQTTERQQAERRLYPLFPDTGPLRRELYPKHLAFFAAGGEHEPTVWCGKDCDGKGHQERALIAANRTGKTLAVCYELVCHLTGLYPGWWQGRRFGAPI